jgi:hypothetical protein
MTKTGLTRRILPAILLSASIASSAMAAEPVQLITREEAGLPATEAAAGSVRNLTRGPAIDTLGTPAKVGSGPFRLAVRFVPSNGVPIEPSSVRIIYRRQPAVDLTARVKPFITAAGIEAPAVVVPPGKHLVEIEATDKEGRTGRSQFTLTVEPPK